MPRSASETGRRARFPGVPLTEPPAWWCRPRCFCACPRRRNRWHEDVGGGPSAGIQHHPRARWPLKGCQSSLAL